MSSSPKTCKLVSHSLVFRRFPQLFATDRQLGAAHTRRGITYSCDAWLLPKVLGHRRGLWVVRGDGVRNSSHCRCVLSHTLAALRFIQLQVYGYSLLRCMAHLRCPDSFLSRVRTKIKQPLHPPRAGCGCSWGSVGGFLILSRAGDSPETPGWSGVDEEAGCSGRNEYICERSVSVSQKLVLGYSLRIPLRELFLSSQSMSSACHHLGAGLLSSGVADVR